MNQILFAEVNYFFFRFFLVLFERICGFFEILAGTRPVYSEGEPIFLLNLLFRQGAISFLFWGVTLIAMALALFFSIFNITTKTFRLSGEGGMGESLLHIGKVMLTFLLTPLMVLSCLNVSSAILNATDDLFAEKYEANLPGYVFSMTTLVAGKRDGGFMGRVDDHIRLPYITGQKRFDNIDTVKNDFHLEFMDMRSGIFLSIALTGIYLFIFLLLILRIFMIVLLYIFSPLFVASMALGDKEIYNKWFHAFLARVLGGFGLVLSYKIIMYIIIPFISSDIRFSGDPFSDIALKFLFVFGAVYGAYKSAGMLSEMINPGADSDEAMVMGDIRKVTVAGVKLAWKVAKIVARGLYSVLTGGAALGWAMLNTAKDTAVDVAKEAAKKAVKETAKAATQGVQKGMQGSDK